MNLQNCNTRSVRALVFGICALFTFGLTSMVFAQNYFPIGAWCFDPMDDPTLYNVDPVTNEHTLVQDERNLLTNLGLTYFIACLKPEGDQAFINFGEELNGNFRTTVSFTALNDPTIQPPYNVWLYSFLFGNVGDPNWENGVNNGYASIGNFYGGSVGLHSTLVGAEHEIHQPDRWDEVEYMSQSVNNNIPGTPISVVENFYTVNISDFVANMPSNDILMILSYPFLAQDPLGQTPPSPPTPTSGPGFQAAVDRMALNWGEAIRAIRDNGSNMDFIAIIQIHESANNNLRQVSQAEVLLSMNMALAYGAKGIVHYLYADTGDQHGLLDANRDPTQMYNDVQQLHQNHLTANGPLFLPLTWREGYSIHLNPNEPIDANYDLWDVTSATSTATDPEAQTYVEVGILQDAGNDNHYMVVNRRATASRDVTMAFESNANGASSDPITFDRSGSSDWYGIVINSGSGSSSQIKFSTIKNADYGLYINGASPTVSNTKINYCGTGVQITSGGAAKFFGNTIT